MHAGSSPLTRGKPAWPGGRRTRFRLIPAHAGKTRPARAVGNNAPAHPRSRGENFHPDEHVAFGQGSSPLTRGKLAGKRAGERSGGLIPAHAGKTAIALRPSRQRGAHPRSRGENSRQRGSARATPGSSPLTRGKHFLTCAFIAQIGQILESLELCASSESYSSPDAYATDALQGRVRSIGLAPRSSRGAS